MIREIVYFYLLLFSLALSLMFVPAAKRLALRFNIMDRPDQRKNHVSARPLLGGLAIYAAFILVILVHLGGFLIFGQHPLFVRHLPLIAAQRPALQSLLPQLLAILTSASVMVVLGFVDDRRGVGFPYQVKFAAQILAAALVVALGVQTTFVPGGNVPNILVTILWIVGMTNAFNLLDNMDGLSAGVAIIASAIFLTLCAAQLQFFSAMILATFCGSILGFWRYNFYPASIFMGDTGSLFIGFMLGVLTITTSYVVPGSSSLLPVLSPVLILSLPIFDTASVVFIRWREGRPLFAGDRRHFSHRLVELGMSQSGAVVFVYLVALSIGVGAALLPYLPVWGSVLVLLQTAAIYAMITILMIVARRKNDPVARTPQDASSVSA